MKKFLILISFMFLVFPVAGFGQKTALLLIDIQDFYFPGGTLPLDEPEKAAQNAAKLLDWFRKKNMFVIHVRHNSESGSKINEIVKPLKGEMIFSKDAVNCFVGTNLLDSIKSNRIDTLVICGMQTHMCVEAATRAASDYGFNCILIHDACATRDLKYGDRIIKAEDVHYSTLATLKNYATVESTDEFLNSNYQVRMTAANNLKLIAEIDSILQSQVDLGKIPGAVILIKKDNNIICQKAYGYAQKYDYNHNLLNPPEEMTVDHLFDIASLTKVIGTTTSVMLLADRGQINIDDQVCKYIKAFDTPDKKGITIRNLLTHTAGLYEWYPLYYNASNKQECYKLIGELPLQFPVGEKRRYSDLGFVVLGEIIEIVSGQPLEQFMEQNIFLPLGMKDTEFNPLKSRGPVKIAATSAGNPYERRMVSDSTLGYRIKEIDPAKWNGWRNYVLKGEVNDGNTWHANGGISGAAGLFSTASDLQKLVDMLINKGKAGPKRYISAKTIETFLTKDKFNNGLGWMMDPSDSFMKNAPEGSFGHTGFTGTSIVAVPRSKISVILLINRQNTGLPDNGEYYNVNPVRMQVFKAVLKYLQ